MPTLRPPRDIEFDQFQRFSAVAALLRPLLADGESPTRILEVGANVLNLLPVFLAPHAVNVVRADLCGVAGAGSNPTMSTPGSEVLAIPPQGPLPAANEAFDFVVALEVLEHIPPGARAYWLGEWARTARRAIVLTVPDGAPAVRRTEELARRYHESAFHEPHPWLAEHLDCGLPTQEELTHLAGHVGLTLRSFANSPLEEWLPLFILTQEFSRQGTPELQRYFNRLLNRRQRRPLTTRRAYRRVYALFRSEEAAYQADELWAAWQTLGQPARRRRRPEPLLALARELRGCLQDGFIQWSQAERERLELAETLRRERAATVHAALAAAPRTPLFPWWSWRRWLTRPVNALKFAQPIEVRPEPTLGPDVWSATSHDPRFHLGLPCPAGWAAVWLRGWGPPGAVAKVYPDFGENFSEDTAIHLGPWNGQGEHFVLAYFDRPVVRFRLDPVDHQTTCRLDHFEVRPMSRFRAAWHGLRRRLTALTKASARQMTWRDLTAALRSPDPRRLVNFLTRPLLAESRRDLERRSTEYRRWCEQNQLSPERRIALVGVLQACDKPPTFEVAVTVQAATPPETWQTTLSSCLAQGYRWVNVRVAAPAHAARAIRAWLAASAFGVDRVHVDEIPSHQPTWQGWNHRLATTDADFLVPVNVGDRLADSALLELAAGVLADPDRVGYYSDADAWTADRGRHHPHFKPDWSPDQYLAFPYTGRLAAYRVAACRAVGGFRREGAAAPEVDLVLRLTAKGASLGHLPRVLYHHGGAKATTPVDGSAVGGVVARHLDDTATDRRGYVELTTTNDFRVRLLPKGTPKVSIIIPSAGRPTTVRGHVTTHVAHAVASVLTRSTYKNHEIFVVANGPLSELAEAQLGSLPHRRVVVPGPFNFSRNLNAAAREATGEYLLFLNDDVEVITPDWLERLLGYAGQPGVGAVGPKLCFPDGTIQHAGIILFPNGPGHPWYGHAAKTAGYWGSLDRPQNFLAVTGACLLSPREAFDRVGGWDEAFRLNYNDVDYCLRLREAGYRTVLVPDAELYHFERVRGEGRDAWKESELTLFKQRWSAKYPRDPFYSPNCCPKAADYRPRLD